MVIRCGVSMNFDLFNAMRGREGDTDRRDYIVSYLSHKVYDAVLAEEMLDCLGFVVREDYRNGNTEEFNKKFKLGFKRK